jgi:proline iminopeptidase
MLYPEIEPHESGLLDVGDGNSIYWEVSGNPAGRPALVLHGGPGSGSSARTRRFFDPEAYRIILFDQRGCGRSTPSAADFDTDLSVNTTPHLIADMERLRLHLGVERWLIYGGSWGCTLGLAYALEHREHVAAMVYAGVTTTRRAEIDWLYKGLAPLYPEEWERFLAGVPEAQRDGDLVAAYYDLLRDADFGVRLKAAQDWHAWDTASVSVSPTASPPPDPRHVMARSRIVTHYFHHNGWLEDGTLLANAAQFNGIPGTLIQGRLDLQGPLVTAWELSKRWTDADLVIVQHAGHATSDGGIPDAIIAATDRFAR